ncbi:MAG: carbamoyl-phosphate synthase large subunit [Candidatus Omnitrophica bacterium]|jgi:carbamoyl-phosphate synthase large subunit|nr:carbamoyl-phosphate synthase large subunit [Candidatus Omnitrophota bacterium]
MPKRKDINRILLIGSGPIIIGQACEFDYSGSQACKALREEGYKVILINSNPATIMTDPEMADITYIEPLIPEVVAGIIKKEKPDALLPTMGGQTALNLTVKLSQMGVLTKYKVHLIGANINAIKKAEDRQLFKSAMIDIGLNVPKSGVAYTLEESLKISSEIGFPIILRPSFTLGGTGGAIVYNIDELKESISKAFDLSLNHEILLEQSVIGWKEFELEVMRDKKDNVVIICSIENFDPMGIHTGDSITVAPAQTLTDKEYQNMRDAAIKIIREVGVETGGSNIQFAINPQNGEMVVIEMNPRVSRSSALASKATGFPIAKIAAKLAIGYTLDEIPNDITKKTPACFEPTIDYCVVKIPKFNFEKFPKSKPCLNTSMKSVGEIMSIGRTFKEALQKGIRSLESGYCGLEEKKLNMELESGLKNPIPERLFYIREAFKKGYSINKIYQITFIDPWFLYNLKEIFDTEIEIQKYKNSEIPMELFKKAKEYGFSDKHIAKILGQKEENIYNLRKKYNIKVEYKMVDTCAGEFEAQTPYYYSTYEQNSIIEETK